jgi:tRNA-specific 2-thiouridylase
MRAELDDVVLRESIALPLRARVRVRYRHVGAWAELQPGRSDASGNAKIVVTFEEPVRAVTRGQIAVFYDGDRVLGGGRIDCAIPRENVVNGRPFSSPSFLLPSGV